MENKENIIGILSHVIFSNEDNGYTVAEIEGEHFDFIAVGVLYGAFEGEKLELTGQWTDHPTYGEQFKVEFFKKIMPTDIEDIYRYLSSGIIKGIRKATASKIVEAFGEDSLKIISDEPAKLAKIKGISLQKACEMSKSFNMQLGTSELFIFLNKFGISANTCMKIYRRHKSLSRDVVMANPYVLCDGEMGVTFQKADEIAMNNGFYKTEPRRMMAGVVCTLKNALQYGHTYLPKDMLCMSAANVLSVLPQDIEPQIAELCRNKKCVCEQKNNESRIYLSEYYKYETYIAKKLSVLSDITYSKTDINIEPQIDIAEIDSSIKFAALQREAVRLAMTESVMVITGGPGTGKTTIINAIINIMKSEGLKVSLTAPTGRAAKRMSQVCGVEAKTIHRLLEVRYSEDDKLECFHNETNPLCTDVVIVDEVSMVDVVLMSSLLKAIRPGTKLCLVGDVNQLPSVGPGNVLSDIISAGKVPVIKLTEIFRQSRESMIVTNAHDINKGEYPLCNVKGSDFYFASIDNPEDGAKYICELCSTRLKNTYGFESSDIQVLSPIKKGITGVNSMNARLQALLNPPQKGKAEKKIGDIVFRVGDRVMQTKNNYDISWTELETDIEGFGVFNGDVGFVEEINTDFKTLTVIYDDKKVVYDFKELSDLTLAYCITVHKSQGSEFPVIIIPMYPGPDMIQNRNLFYTGVTRAKKLVILVGRAGIIKKMVDNNRQDKRYSALVEKICNEFDNEII
ncbi:MAG: ATP-dependent RecD-like DNA helicase [Clostridia bacterium]|nr:ATP-dependent RecD-like DNA helicase [Clostridia bacterium]